MPASHVAYGLCLTANLPIPGLPLRPDVQTTDVQIWLGEPAVFPIQNANSLEFIYTSPDRVGWESPCLRVAVDPSGEYFAFLYHDGARFAVDRHGREVWGDWPQGYTVEDACTYLLGPVMGLVLRLRGIHCLHASGIVLDNGAIALAGPPGAGKSTLAAAFGRSGFPVLSDDIVALKEDDGRFFVQPGYPRVNLWPESVRMLFGFENALSRITPTWDKRYLALDEKGCRFATEPSLLRVIYILGEREPCAGEVVIEELADSEAFMALVANSYSNYLLDRDMRSREFAVLGQLFAGVPVRRIRPTTDPADIPTLCEAIAGDSMRLTADEPLTTPHYR